MTEDIVESSVWSMRKSCHTKLLILLSAHSLNIHRERKVVIFAASVQKPTLHHVNDKEW